MPTFRERLLPGPVWWLVVAGLVAMVAIAYGAALGSSIGMIVAATLGVPAGIGLWFASPVLAVDAYGLHCAHATLPSNLIGAHRLIRGRELDAARRGHDPQVPTSSYVVMPSWAPKSAVVLEVEDPDDPHRAWIVASRRPVDLQAALIGLIGQSRGSG